ncbi:MAG: hypothetical protein PHT41_06700 [Candidatus Omnitrophica bacterium]|nr:hypothetical protein [Candidatus Omnitrophota bacterium]MDD5237694.1 hypothetical protein [Candidatus Omnitrophota bacterium]
MSNTLLMQLFALSLYTLFMGFTFCDGFKLHILRKLLWFSVFAAISIYVIKTKNEFNLSLILPIPTLLAILLCAYEKIRSKGKTS